MNKLPFNENVETIEVYKKVSSANYALGELNGLINLLPNPDIVLNAISLREAKDSSEIENIVTTYDEIFNTLGTYTNINNNEKEVLKYKKAILLGYEQLKDNSFINTNSIISIQEVIENSKSGIRTMPGTVIMNPRTKEIVHNPPQAELEIRDYLRNFEIYLNEDSKLDPLIDLAITHYQFESIHPFYDGNGRTGRIINILFLVLKKKLSYPILYLSKYINDNREEYYKHLRLCNEDLSNIHDFVIYMVEGIEETSKDTIAFIESVVSNMSEVDDKLKSLDKSYYSSDLVDFIYSYFYITIELYAKKYNVSRQTAALRLDALEVDGVLKKEKRGRRVVYLNLSLITLMKNW